MDSLALLQDFVAAPGPPGLEAAVRDLVLRELARLGVQSTVDAKGNVVVRFGSAEKPKVVVTAHMDEIGLQVRSIEPDGSLRVMPLGGIFPWKLGEGPVLVMASGGHLTGILGFGSIHTESNQSGAKRAKTEVLTWDMACVVTHLSTNQLEKAGVRPGTRVVVHPSRRTLTQMGHLVSGYFLDDRADLVSWIQIIEAVRGNDLSVVFLATASEEVGGEGALYALGGLRPEICIALELGPNVPDAPVELDDRPTVWVTDAYASMPPHLAESVVAAASAAEVGLQFQALSRGGSDASCAAGKGLCAHPITLGIAMENSHGYEIMHRGAMDSLANLTIRLLHDLCAS